MPTVSPDFIAAPPPPSPYLARGVVDQSDDGEPSPFAKLLGEQNAGTPAEAADSASSSADSSAIQCDNATASTRDGGAAKSGLGRQGQIMPQRRRWVAGALERSRVQPARPRRPRRLDPAVLTVTAAEAADASAVTESALPVISAAGSGAPKDDVAGTVAPNGTGRVSRGRTSKAQAADDQSSIGQILNSSQQSNAQAANVPMPSGQILTGQMPTTAPTGPAPTGQASTGQPIGGEASGGPPAIGEVSAGADLKSLIPMASASIGQQPDGQGSNPTGTQAGAPVVAAPINLPAANVGNASSSNSGSGAIAALGAAAVTIPAGRTLPVAAGTTGSTIAGDPGDQIPVAGTAVRAQASGGFAVDRRRMTLKRSKTLRTTPARNCIFERPCDRRGAIGGCFHGAYPASAVSAEADDRRRPPAVCRGRVTLQRAATPSPSFLSATAFAVCAIRPTPILRAPIAPALPRRHLVCCRRGR